MGAHTIGNAEIFNSGFHGPWVSGEATMFNNQYYANLRYSTVQYSTHLPWRPVNLDVSAQRQFHFPRALFTCLMKNWGVPEIIARELLHSGQNFRGIYKSIKNDIFGLENNLYLHYSHKGVIVRVEETISKLQNWHTCKNFRGTLPCNLSKCADFHT